MIIDVHAHYYPRRYLELIGRPDLPPIMAAALAVQSTAERLLLLDQNGIDTQVLSVSQAQPYLPDPAAAAEAAKVGNEEYLSLCAAHPGRFLAFAALPLPHVDQALAEIGRVAAADAVVGFTLGCSVAGRQLDDPLFEPVLAELDRRGAVVFLHPVGQEDTPWLSGHNLVWMVGAPFEDTAAALRLVLSGVPERFPNLKFIVPHLGGTLPFLFARIGAKSAEAVGNGLRTMYFDTVSGSAEALASAGRLYGTGRLLFGTDYPYCDEPQFRHHLSYLDEAGLTAEELEQITGGTAEALLRPALPVCHHPGRLEGDGGPAVQRPLE
jgi:6-methylsalicylate decarboxylase